MIRLPPGRGRLWSWALDPSLFAILRNCIGVRDSHLSAATASASVKSTDAAREKRGGRGQSTWDTPTAAAIPLEYVDDSTLRVAGGPGYGALGEPMHHRFTPSGAVKSVDGPGGTVVPIADFALPNRIRAPRSQTMG